MLTRKTAATLSAVGISALLAGPAPAQDFYAGRTLTIVVGNPAGSGYDAYARLLGRHVTRHIPGRPNVIVQNMPGAGGVKATDFIANVAPKDGTVLGLTMPGALVDPLTGDPAKFRYSPERLAYVGTMDSGTRLCMTFKSSKVRSVAIARTTPAVMAATQVGSSAHDYPHFLNALAGTQFKVVTGYTGPGDLFLAAERGEADGLCGIDISTFTAMRPNWLEGEGRANALLQAGLEANPKATALGFPSIWEFVKAQDKSLVELIVGQQVFQRPVIAPQDTPGARLAILRAAFMAAPNDQQLLAEAGKSELELNPRSGEDVEALVRKMYSAPKDLIQRMARVIRP